MNRVKPNSLHLSPPKPTTGSGLHRKKIMTIRRQLARGKYNMNERLIAVLDKILEDIIDGGSRF